jgi:hypothetical protein
MLMLVIVGGLGACGNKSKEAPPAVGSGSAPAPVIEDAATGSGAGSATADAEPLDVPTEVDFEDLASSEITDKNVEARMKELESDLAEQ